MAGGLAVDTINGHNIAGGFIGTGQTWQNVIGSRSRGVTYTNTTGKPIMVVVHDNAGPAGLLVVGGVTLNRLSNYLWYTAIVPNNTTYSFSGSFTIWTELR